MKRVKTIYGIIIAPLLSWIFPVFFLYAQNVKEMQMIEIVQPTSIFIVCMITSLLLGRILFKEWNIASVFSFICGLFLGNFALILKAIQRVFPIVRYWHLIFAMLIASIVLCKVLNHKKDLAKEVTFVGTIALGGLMAFNLIMAVPTIVTKLNVALTSEKNVSLNSQESIEGKRNIYYLLCDEYASFAQLEKDFGYDNSEFKVKLQNLGFNISESSYNDSCKTVVVMANIMQLEYKATDDSTAVELDKLTKNGRVQDILRENGYKLKGIGDTGWLGVEGTLEGTGGAKTADGADAMRLALDKSFLGLLIKRNYSLEAQKIVNSFDELNRMEIVPNSSTFTMFYVSAPHHPYYLSSNGNMNPEEKWINDETGNNNDAYLGEIEYVNKRIYSAVKRIIRNDPEAIIVLCSDHGNRFGKISGDMTKRTLNTMYYAGNLIKEFEGMSGVNTLRYIFNTEFGTNLPYIDLPVYE